MLGGKGIIETEKGSYRHKYKWLLCALAPVGHLYISYVMSDSRFVMKKGFGEKKFS